MVATSCTHVLQPFVFDLNKYITIFFVKDIKQLDMVTAHIRREMVTPTLRNGFFFFHRLCSDIVAKEEIARNRGRGWARKEGHTG